MDLRLVLTGGGPASVVFSAPLNAGSPEEWLTGLTKLRDRFQGVSSLQLDTQRCRPAFAEAPALRKASGGGASRRQAQGFSEGRTGRAACHGQVGWTRRLPRLNGGGEGGNGLPKWSQSRPCDRTNISRKPRPMRLCRNSKKGREAVGFQSFRMRVF